jgi:hypothetical protein
MSDDPRETGGYEPPEAEELKTSDGPTTTAAGATDRDDFN